MATKFFNLFLLLGAFTVSAQTNPPPWCCRYPLRVLSPKAGVNLQPLFDWWIENGGTNVDRPESQQGYLAPNRPLAAWKRITGVKTGDLDGVWVVAAQIYLSPTTRTNSWILLRNPPAAEEQQYYNLQSQVAEDGRQIDNEKRINQVDLQNAQKEDAEAKELAAALAKSTRMYAGDHTALAAEYRKAAAIALKDEKQFEQGRAQAQRELDALPAEDGRYKLDIFALELGRNNKGQLVYDAGQIYRAAP